MFSESRRLALMCHGKCQGAVDNPADLPLQPIGNTGVCDSGA